MRAVLAMPEDEPGHTRLNPKQFDFVENSTAREQFLEGGWGSGKTHALAHKACRLSQLNGVQHSGMIVTLTGPLMKTVILPEMEKVFRAWGATWHHHQSAGLITWDGGGPMWLRTAEHPERLEGANMAWTIADECGQTTEDFHMRLKGRTRGSSAPFKQRCWVGRPEGTRTWFNKAIVEIQEGKHPKWVHIRATMRDNAEFLGAEYIEDILEATEGDEAMRQQLMEGVAADESGNIYGVIGEANLQKCERPELGQIVTGWDFNAAHMPTPIGSWDANHQVLHIFCEAVSSEERFPEFKGHRAVRKVGNDLGAMANEHAEFLLKVLRARGVSGIVRGNLVGLNMEPILAFIDATGHNRNRTPKSDAFMVKEAGFTVVSGSKNPDVRDRVAAVRRALKRVRLLIDPVGAPLTLAALRGHTRDDSGKPQKDFGGDLPLDHWCDAVGYMVHGLMPIRAMIHAGAR